MASFVLLSCTATTKHQEQACREAKPYDYSNFPPVEKGELPYVPTYVNCPTAIADALERNYRCTWWYGEEKFHRDSPGKGSEAKRQQALSMMKGLRCDSVDDDVQRMKQQYQYDPSIQRVLDNASIDAVI